MKKSLFSLLLVAFFATSFISCDKDEDDDGPTIEDNSWVINNVTFKTPTLNPPSFTGANFTALDPATNGGGSLTLTFAEKPTTSKNYTVILGTNTPTGDQVRIAATSVTAPNLYLSTGRTGDVAVVTVNSGKVTVTLNNVEMLYTDGSTERKTTLSAKLIEG